MSLMRPRIGFALVGAALLATGVTSMAVAAQNQAPAGPCYSTCPPDMKLDMTPNVVNFGSEEVADFSVIVGPDFIGAGLVPTGTVTVKAGSTVLCTITLVRGRGSCSPSADALPGGQTYPIEAFYNGDANFSPSHSNIRELVVSDIQGGD